VIHRFLLWTCSQVLCDYAYKIWWDLDLIWPFDHRVFPRTRAEKLFLGTSSFFLSPVEPALANGSTGDQSFAKIRVLGFLVYCTVVVVKVSVASTSVQPALSFCFHRCIELWAFPRRINRCSLSSFVCLSGQLHRHWFRFCWIIRCYYAGWTDVVQTYTSDQPVLAFLVLQALYHRLNRRTQVYVRRINRWYIPCWILCCFLRLLPCLFSFVPRVVLCWCSSSIAIPHFT